MNDHKKPHLINFQPNESNRRLNQGRTSYNESLFNDNQNEQDFDEGLNYTKSNRNQLVRVYENINPTGI